MKGSSITLFLMAIGLVIMLGCTAGRAAVISDSKATLETKQLLKQLHKSAHKGVILGQQDVLAYGIGWWNQPDRCDFKEVCGDYPGLFGWEIGGLELGHARNLDSVLFTDIIRYVKKAYALGAINTISWHLNNPVTKGDSWDTSGGNVVKTLLPDGTNHALYCQWLDRVAAFFGQFVDDHGRPIPFIFRPFHELTGDWFWWGSKYCGSTDYVKLWQFSIDYLRAKGVHHMLLAYSTAYCNDYEMFMARYPGNRYVDIIGFDLYQFKTAGVADYVRGVEHHTEYARRAAKEQGKIWAFCETGYESVPDEKWFTETLYPLISDKNCAYVQLWRNAYNRPNHFYGSYVGHSSASDLAKLASFDDVLTAAKLRR